MNRLPFTAALPIAVIGVGFTLAACATPPREPKIEIREVQVAVPVRCALDPYPAKPDLPDTDQALASAADVFVGAKLLKAGRRLRDAYIGELEAALSGCTSP